MSGRLLVVGSVNHDLVVAVERLPAPGETVLGGRAGGARRGQGRERGGGRRAARRVGGDGRRDGRGRARGRRARRRWRRRAWTSRCVARLEDAPTGVAVVAVDAAGENQIVVAPGANAAVTAAQVEAALAARAGAVDAVLVSCEMPDEAVAAAVRGAHERGLRCVLNPAPARPSLLELAPWAPLLTPNRAEAARLAGEDEPESAAVALAARTGAPVVVTLGEAGALLVDGRRGAVAALPGPRGRRCVDTTGAGDAFNGALGARLALGDALADAVAYAVAAAGLRGRRRSVRGRRSTAADGRARARAGRRRRRPRCAPSPPAGASPCHRATSAARAALGRDQEDAAARAEPGGGADAGQVRLHQPAQRGQRSGAALADREAERGELGHRRRRPPRR